MVSMQRLCVAVALFMIYDGGNSSPSSGSNSGLVEKNFHTLYGTPSSQHCTTITLVSCLSFSVYSASSFSSFDCFAISYFSFSFACSCSSLDCVATVSLPLGCSLICLLLLDLRLCRYLFLRLFRYLFLFFLIHFLFLKLCR
jgi:hypothetical protein